MRVLLIEDEAEMASWLVRAFKQSGLVPDHAPDAASAEALLACHDYDAVVLDLQLPDKHGLTILAEMRRAGNRTPVLILTAQGALQDRVKGLNAGADDFLTKPFAVEELEARISALVRRSRGRSHAPLQCGSLTCAHDSRAFMLAGTLLQLTPRELWGKVFPADSDAGPDAIELVLHRLRRKLTGADVRIVTVRGLGYMLESIKHETVLD